MNEYSEKEICNQLVMLRDDMYNGNWDKMLADLNDRLQHPHTYNISNAKLKIIEADIGRIKEIMGR